MASHEIDDFQDIILNNAVRISKEIPKINASIAKSTVNYFEWLAKQNHDNMSFVLGDFGKNLCSFCDKVDMGHPYLMDLCTSCGIDDTKLSLLKEIVSASEYIRSNKLLNLANLLKKQFIKFKEIDKSVVHHIAKPAVRLLKDVSDRKQARRTKNPSSISLSSLLQKFLCSAQPDNFKSYFCGYNYADELEEQEKMKRAFLDMQVAAFRKQIDEQISQTKARVTEQYFGFIRLKMDIAPIIMAKEMKLQWLPGAKCIQVNRSMFTGKSMFWLNITDNHLKYQPNKYPLHSFNVDIPDRTAKILDLVESYPVVGDRPIFDHYWVVCPSFQLDPREFYYDARWHLRIDGSAVSIDWSPDITKESDMNRASMALDFYLTKIQAVVPVVLGERNGECFFLCYWR